MQPEKRTGIAVAPNLVLLPCAASPDASHVQVHDGGPSILGLGLAPRTVLAARRAGCGQIFFLGREHPALSNATAISNWEELVEVLVRSPPATLIVAPATILSEVDWLQRLVEMQIPPAAWAGIPHRIVVVAAAAVPDALAKLNAEGGACNITAVEERLTRRFGPAATVSSSIDPMVVVTSKDIHVAERRLLHALRKDTDGFMARHVERPISLQLSRRLAPTAVTPNEMTMISAVVGLCAAPFFLSALWLLQTVGALLFLTHSIVDGCDGELARLRFQESRYGGILDFWGDNIVHVAVFGCMALGWTLSSGAAWPLLLGAAAIVGTLGSASFVHWRQLRIKDGSGPLFTSVSAAPEDPIVRLLDAASRRDFIYLVLVLAFFGKSNWFLILAAIGAPIFFFLLVFLALRERFQSIPARPSP